MAIAKQVMQGEAEFIVIGETGMLPATIAYCRSLIGAGRVPVVVIRQMTGTADGFLVAGDMLLDTETSSVWIGSRQVVLTRRELAILHLLMRKPGVAISRAEISRRVWGRYPLDSPILPVLIRALRKKIERDPSAPCRIRTVRHYGYQLDCPDAPAAAAAI